MTARVERARPGECVGLRAAGHVRPHSLGRRTRACVRASEGPWCVVCARPAVERVRVRAERENRAPPAFELAARRARKVSERQGQWGGPEALETTGPGGGRGPGSRFSGDAPSSRTPRPGRRGRAAGGAAPPTPSALSRSAARVAPQAAAPWAGASEMNLCLTPVSAGEGAQRGRG